MTMAKTTVQPLFSYVLIKPAEAESKTASGIVLVDTGKEKPQMGEIIAVGTGFESEDGREEKMIVKVGQKVMYKKWGGNEVKVDGADMLLVEQKDIMAIVG